MSRATAPLALAELVRVDPLARGEVAVLPDPAQRVLRVELAETFDRLAHTPAHSLVVLHAEAATGGWSLAAALHVAWERGAAGVVVPRPAMSEASAVLARRLGTALLVVDDDAVDVALELAARTAAPEAARALRVARCAEELAEQSSVRGVLGVLNAELSPGLVALVAGGSVLAGRAAAAAQRDGYREVRMAVNGPGGRAWAVLVASLPEAASAVAAEVEVHSAEAVLRLARLPLLAAWAQRRLDTSAQAAQERAAFQVLRAQVRLHSGADLVAPGLDDDAGQGADGEVPSWSTELGWRVEGVNRAVWLQREGWASQHEEEPAPELTQLLRSQWARLRPGWPLVPDDGGWVSWQNSPEDTAPAALRRALTGVASLLTDHGLVLGVGASHPGPAGLVRSVEEARLGARVGGGPGGITWFEDVGVRAVLAQVSVPEVADVAALALPRLASARDRLVIAETVASVLDHGGSLVAASAELGVHRNTVLARTARARELGLALDDPGQRLPLHVACHGLVRAWRATGSS
ncbi:PucR C-terminal helix-turn-helix domain-containing protein [Quadrisphaera granulorum]|uniref:PucR-like helix-turn-helix protein n=1 Tax=Quadrisphaera granulorum TaxID=317664 RepID=A0A315ZVC2_9ACTN|nr:helix-turn-helix domain-containing protein [Quadrisphaera granulorum]PWJ49561.1 PucR-like helix-turn-helix protein [Quadrisphaera granulorum]SZE98140.1 PucR C-terminal helix-turn-helix domain-containing protein [Quadrisphaera granulorum]